MCHIAELLMHSNTEKSPACEDNPKRKIAFSCVSLDMLSFFQNLPFLSCSELFQQCFRALIERVNNKKNLVRIIGPQRYHSETALLHRYKSKQSPLPPCAAGDSIFLITEDTNSLARMSIQSHICPTDVNLD